MSNHHSTTRNSTNLPPPPQIENNITNLNKRIICNYIETTETAIHNLANICYKLSKLKTITAYTDGSMDTDQKMGFGW